MSQDSPPLPLDDIQGVVLRGYNFAVVRHFVLRISVPSGVRSLVARLVGGPDPKISSAADWGPNPPGYRLQIGFTYAGLATLPLPEASLAGFRSHRAFFEGPVAHAERIGDTEASAPAKWIGHLNETASVHLLLSLYARDPATLSRWTDALRQLWSGSLSELSAATGNQLPDHSIHFGYQDGMSQPTIEGAPPSDTPSTPPSPPGLFLLGQPVPWPERVMPVPPPAELGHNGSFAAFRILKQDVAKFEEFLTEATTQTGRSREWVAAKLCGRWRNGVPLVLSPNTDSPEPAIPPERLDEFDYENDARGERCPFGSHMRRAFPRGDLIAGGKGEAYRRRIVRRGMPYGPPFDPGKPDDDERGLLGLFICASLDEQFEFIMSEWINKGSFTGTLSFDMRDPLLGVNVATESKMPIPTPAGSPIEVHGFERFVTTRGSAYIFLPSLTALRFIGSLG